MLSFKQSRYQKKNKYKLFLKGSVGIRPSSFNIEKLFEQIDCMRRNILQICWMYFINQSNKPPTPIYRENIFKYYGLGLLIVYNVVSWVGYYWLEVECYIHNNTSYIMYLLCVHEYFEWVVENEPKAVITS